MTSRTPQIDTGVGASFIVSAVIHLAVFLLLAWWGVLTPPRPVVPETYYVDMVTAPAPEPQPAAAAAAEPVAPKPPPAPPVRVKAPVQVHSPVKAAVKPTGKPAVKSAVGVSARPVAKAAVRAEPVQETPGAEENFNERLARLQGKAEAQQYEERFKKLNGRKTSVGTGKVPAPAAGSGDPRSYIMACLRDALMITISYKSKKSFVKVSLVISGEGKLSQMKIIETSGDATFGLAVMRAVDLANETFVAPPGSIGNRFEVIFHPD